MLQLPEASRTIRLASDFTATNEALKKGNRMRDNWLLFTILAVSVLGLLLGVALLSRRERVERRRRRSHGRIVSKVNRPMVRFSVRPPKK
jgi:hypothetical protein